MMDTTQRIPQYFNKKNPKRRSENVTEKEFRRQDKRLKSAKDKNRKQKKQYKQEEAQRKHIEQILEKERSINAQQVMKAQLQTKLDALTFYGKEEEDETWR